MYVAEKEGIYDGALMEDLARGWRIWRGDGGFGAGMEDLVLHMVVGCTRWITQHSSDGRATDCSCIFGYLLVAGSIPAAEKN